MVAEVLRADDGAVGGSVSVFDDDDFEFFAQGDAKGGIDAEVGGKAGEDEGGDASGAELGFEFGFVKGVAGGFATDEVVGVDVEFWVQFPVVGKWDHPIAFGVAVVLEDDDWDAYGAGFRGDFVDSGDNCVTVAGRRFGVKQARLDVDGEDGGVEGVQLVTGGVHAKAEDLNAEDRGGSQRW
jgi:hypothetical protein